MTFANFLSVAWEAATVAGALMREHWQKPKSIDYKGAIDLVTSVDRECERRIVEVLRSYFPNHSILAEEETDWVGTEGSHRWIIDPLDGTTNFAHGYPQFCVSIALEYDGEVILGLVYDPPTGRVFQSGQRRRGYSKWRSDADFRRDGIGQGASRHRFPV